MKIKELFEGKEESYGVITTTEDGSKKTYFKTREERDSYIKKMKEKLGNKLKRITPLELGADKQWSAMREDVWGKDEYKRKFKDLYDEYKKKDIEDLRRMYQKEHNIPYLSLVKISKSDIIDSLVRMDIGNKHK